MHGEPEASKKPTLIALARILGAARVPYAIIGGVALQVHHDEPRTTLDIDLAVDDRRSIPAEALRSAGFALRGSHEHSENWSGPDGTPVQFTDDPDLAGAVRQAQVITVEDVELRVLRAVDLLHAKLRAAGDPARRRSKRVQDLADALSLVDADPALAAQLGDEERQLLARLPP